MFKRSQLRNSTPSLSGAIGTLALAIVFVLTVAAGQRVLAQTFRVIHTFTGGQDGGNPYAGVTLDKAGNLYGTTYSYGAHSYGTVYQLKLKNGNWTVNPLYSFSDGTDGARPRAGVVFSRNGTLYGTTIAGGDLSCNYPYGCGVVFNLRPSALACKSALCAWTETVLYAFKGSPDGAFPGYGDLIFDDQTGNIYDTTNIGGTDNAGTAYQLTPSGGGDYTESVIYSFGGGSDGYYPNSGLTLDDAKNLYGTTYQGGLHNEGTVFQLVPSIGYTENILYSFLNGNGGSYLIAGVMFDSSGNLYGATTDTGMANGGEVFEMTPLGNNNWSYTQVYGLTGSYGGRCGPWGNLVMDKAGNLYGTTYCDGANKLGSVFELINSQGTWTYKDLYDFTGGNDGKNPYGHVAIDGSGNLYGTASAGGSAGVGVVWEITFP